LRAAEFVLEAAGLPGVQVDSAAVAAVAAADDRLS
jgi:hypothetical protein